MERKYIESNENTLTNRNLQEWEKGRQDVYKTRSKSLNVVQSKGVTEQKRPTES